MLLFQQKRVLIIGDSHVRRIHQVFHEIIQNAAITWMHKGGSGIGFIYNCKRQIVNYDVVVIATGGNDIANGKGSRELAHNFYTVCQELLRVNNFVIVCSQWPRANRVYNDNISAFNYYLEYIFSGSESAKFRWWDRRLKFATFDGVHLHSYHRAARHLASMILFGLRTLGA